MIEIRIRPTGAGGMGRQAVRSGLHLTGYDMNVSTSDRMQDLLVHASMFPDRAHRDYVAGFRSRDIDPKLHYATVRQARQWLRIHEELSPARRDEECASAYDRCFRAAAERLAGDPSRPPLPLRVVSLGCGSGDKDLLLLERLSERRSVASYHPVDASLPLAIVSARKVREGFAAVSVRPLLADVLEVEDFLPAIAAGAPPRTTVVACFGMLHGFRPGTLPPALGRCMRGGDLLLLGANLAPGADYGESIRRVLPQYDNPLTREWLMSALLDAGVAREDGTLRFCVEDDDRDERLQRITARFHVHRDVTLRLDASPVEWRAGDVVRLFSSYRYTTPLVRELLQACGIDLVGSWEPGSGEEGVYLCRKA